ncbi:hypothetical protein AVEN_128240-1 [Araneus ventricosus]|uniref:Uncharacterized protein n=1 Tax=Araneus ventricosus TaxID=182803 RepID=A0A4Y2A1C2_ARAVE|nr:hypothetical protein AVEN_128240-1 [Araneus ventricosus]
MGSGHSRTPDLGDKFGNLGDKSMIPENATLFSISLLGKKIRSNVRENSMRRHGLSGRVYKDRIWIRESSVGPTGTTLEFRLQKLVN